MLLVLNLPLAGVWARVMLVPRPLLFGGILVLASVGAYSLNRSILDLVLLYVRRRGRLRDARLRRSARAGGARPDPRAAVGAAVPARPGDQRRRSLGVRHAADLRDAAGPCVRGARRPVPAAPLAARRRRRHDAIAIYDVAVLGGGNAGLVRRAHGARSGRERHRRSNARRAHFRGGNSRHTRNLRCMHDAPDRRPHRRLSRRTSSWRICCA